MMIYFFSTITIFMCMDELIKKIIKEESEGSYFSRMEIKLFKFINNHKKQLGTKEKMIEFLRNALPSFNIPVSKASEYYHTYMLNYLENGNYESITKSNFKDPKKHSTQIKTSNINSGEYTHNKLPFKGSNLEGKWTIDKNNVWTYIVLSYGWFPIYVYKYDKWFQINRNYSSSTAKQMRHSNPTYWNSDINEDVIVVSEEEMKKIISGSMSIPELISQKESLFTEKVSTTIKKPMFSTSGWYNNKIKISFTIDNVMVENNQPKVDITIFDVNKMDDRKVINSNGSFFNDSMEDISKSRVIDDIKFIINRGLLFLLGKEHSDDLIDVNVNFNYIPNVKQTSFSSVISSL